jgi:NTE family protein
MTRVGLVLGAGGFAGQAFHSGVLSALEEALGWDPRTAEVIVGTSAGSQVGTLLRHGLTAADLANHQLGRPLSPRGGELMSRIRSARADAEFTPPSAREFLRAPRLPTRRLIARTLRHPWASGGALWTSFLPDGPVSTEAFAEALRSLTGTRWPDEALWICACRMHDGERVVFGGDGHPETDVATAVAASCAIPGVFAPVEIGGMRYVDGGVHSPTNLDLLAGLELDLAVVVSPMSAAKHYRGMDMPLRRLFRLRLGGEAARVRRSGTPVVAFQPGPDEIRAMGINAMDPNPDRWKRAVRLVRERTFARLERPDVGERLLQLAA